MLLASFDDYAIGVVSDAALVDVSAAVPAAARHTPWAMNTLIEQWEQLRPEVDRLVRAGSRRALSGVRLLPPVPRPGQLLAAPANYHDHVDEMSSSIHLPQDPHTLASPREVGFFVKSSASVVGPADAIELPDLPGRSFHHEVELGLVIGRAARGVPVAEARSHIFGYLVLLDITLRTEGEQQEERTMRKSFQTFTPTGPFLVTADEVTDPDTLDLWLDLNGEPRQRANTRDLIVGIDELVSAASRVVTLSPGDVYATGTPAGVGPITPGDELSAGIGGVGELRLPVVQRGW